MMNNGKHRPFPDLIFCATMAPSPILPPRLRELCSRFSRWNQLDLAIVLLSIMGITLEEIEVNASLPINPTIIRIMRVLRIARGRSSACTCLPQTEMERVGYADGSGFPGVFSQPLH